ncbi:hypothetical protein FJR28_05245 [Francisella tularensis]|uniref:hypothetical protein n=1 Tax=Francisella tularensis TaxID=263 RepID=UPI00189FEEA0|nr:hypothetical protein [Francisella tularensis]MBF6993975.1 hypothetical protein [Francisella tularensis]MBF6996746.1 hypothetical protein [Francisella tularensis]MBF6998715.1 hypothetical protein [Francisella tularensis]MBF7006818.1 hypothetical protein [Francisella tularensis]
MMAFLLDIITFLQISFGLTIYCVSIPILFEEYFFSSTKDSTIMGLPSPMNTAKIKQDLESKYFFIIINL